MKTRIITIIALIIASMSVAFIGCTQNDVGTEKETASEELVVDGSELELESNPHNNMLQEEVLPITDTKSEFELDKPMHEQNEAYKMFYGTWEYVRVVSQHHRNGGDEGYEELIGLQVTYSPQEYRSNGAVIYNPTYYMSIYPMDRYIPFISSFKQKNPPELSDDSDYFIWVQIVNKPSYSEARTDEEQYADVVYAGNEFLIKDDNTIYCSDKGCFYELRRVSYMEGYDSSVGIQYSEAW